MPMRPAGPSPLPATPLLQVLAAACILIGLAACNPTAPQAISDIPHTPIPKVDARLRVAMTPEGPLYQGLVRDEQTRARLLEAFRTISGTPGKGELSVDPNTHPAAWASNIGPLLAVMPNEASVAVEGKRLVLDGSLNQEQRARVLRKARQLYPDYQLGGLFANVDMSQALPDAGDENALIEFLNAMPIEFESESGMLSPASVAQMPRAGRAIQAAATPDTRLQVGVYPESANGDDGEIATQRAEALQTQLALRGISPVAMRTIRLAPTTGKGGQPLFAKVPPASGATPAPGADPAAQTPPAADDSKKPLPVPADTAAAGASPADARPKEK